MGQELDEILLGFVEEMEGYIPVIRDGVAELRQRPDNRPVLDEMHRLMHIVKGAAAMLGVDPLSQAAKSMELALDHLRVGGLRPGEEHLAAVERTVGLFERYAAHLRSGGAPDDPELQAEVAEILAQAEALPQDGAGGAGAASPSPAGVTIPAGLELDDELMASFVEEANEHFADINNALHRLETLVTAPVPVEGEVGELARGLRRAVHTIKGASAVLGLQHIADVGREVEDVLEWFAESAREMEPDHVAILSQLLRQLDHVARNPDEFDAEMVEDCLTLLKPLMASGEGETAAVNDDAAALLDDEASFLDEPSELLADAETAEDEALFAADAAVATDMAETAAPAESAEPLLASAEESAPSVTPSGIELDDELMAAFTEEVDEHFDGISTALHTLEGLVETTTPVQGEVSEQLRGIRRFVHTVKGASAVLGLQHIADVGHRIEDVLDWFYESASDIDPEELGVLAQVLDQFENLVRAPANYDAALVDDGLALLQRKMTSAAPGLADATAPGDAADALLGDESALLDDSSALLADGDAAFPEDATAASAADSLAESPAPPAMTPSGIELDDELLAAFTEEVNEHFDGISASLHTLENLVETTTPVQGEVSEELRGIRRFVHTVKGASAVIGLQHIADVGHRIEDVLDWFYESASEIDPEELGVLARVLDQFENLVRAPSNYDAAVVDDGLALLQGKMTGAATDHAAGAASAAATTDAADALLDDESALLDDSSALLAGGEATFPEDATAAASAAESLAESPAPPAMTPSGIELDDELLAAFTEEVNEHFDGISASLHTLENLVETTTPVQGEVSEELRGIRRFVHTVKGASAVIGLQHIADVGHRIEDVLDWFYESASEIDPEELGVLARVLDQFENLVRTPSGYDAAQVDEGLAFLRRKMTGAPGEAAAAVKAAAATPAPQPEQHAATEAETTDAAATPASLFSEEELRVLREGFMEEADEHLQELSRSMQNLESRVGQKMPMDADLKEEVRTIRRAVHTIKGASAVIGITDISGYAHKVEDFLDWLFEQAAEIDPDIVSLVAESVDILGSIVENPASVGEGRREDMFARLAAVSGGGAAAAPAAAPARAGAEAAAKLSEQELELMRRAFADEAELYVEKLHHGVQAVAGCVGEDGPLSQAARDELGRLLEQVRAIHKTATTLGNGDVGAPTAAFARFLDWLRASDIVVGAATLVDGLADAADVIGRLMDRPDEVSWERIDDVMDKLDGIRQLDPSGGGLPQPQHIDRKALAELASAAESRAAADLHRPQVKQEPRPAAPAKAAATDAAAAEAAKTIRIHQNQLDKFINLANELLVGVSGFDRNMSRFQGALEELDLTVRRLKGIALELETKFEVKALDQISFHFDRIEQARQEIQAETNLASLDEFDAMELDHYTQLNLIIRALNESAVDVAALHTNLESIHNGLGVDINRQHRVVRELQVQLMRARLSPMSMLTPRLSRTMRDVAARLQKRVRLVMEGDTVELDRVIWEKLADPFMHLVRNSVHHGIEEAKEREAAGKPAIATIKIAGAREGHHVVIRYSDDGRGLNIAAIRERARRNMGDAVDALDENELVDLIFTPGFSTQKVVTQISGRGVGMDVVKQNVQDLQGSIGVSTTPGRGTEFAIRVPLTLGVVRALLVEVDHVTYGIALNEIRDIHRIERKDIAEDGRSFMREGAPVALYNLPLLLGREVSSEDLDAPQPLVLTIESEGELAGIRIPHIAGQKEVVLKGLGSHLRAVTGIAGAAVMGDGTVIPLLNAAELLAAYRMQERPEEVVRKKEEKPKALTVMIVDDSISIRRVMSRLVANHGWIPMEAKDGQDAFEKLDSVRPDCILLDIEMPRMNGYEFLALKANLPEHKHIPVIMLTSRTSDKHRNKAMELGASVFLNKPPKDEEFVEAVLRLTGHGRSRMQIRQWEGAR